MMAVGLIIGGPGTQDSERLTARSATLRGIILRAYGIKAFQLIGPNSLDSSWDINAKIPAGATPAQVNGMLQTLLEGRFHLKVHHEAKEIPAYRLTVAKGGLKLRDSLDTTRHSSQVGIAKTSGRVQPSSTQTSPQPDKTWVMLGKAVPTSNLASVLQNWVGGRPVLDQTGLGDTYDFRVEFASADLAQQDDSPALSIFTALEKDLGLKLEAIKAPFDTILIDHIDAAPSDN